MRLIKILLVLALFGLAFVGCSNSKQHKDPSWTAKPANLQVVFTAPVILNTEKDADGGFDWPIFPWYYVSTTRTSPSPLPIATKDSLMLPDEMKKMSEWFRSNVDNTLKFNASVHYNVNEVPKEKVSYSELGPEGDNLRVPMLKSMPDSAEVYLILDGIQLKSYVNLKEGAGTTMKSVGMTIGATISDNCVQISATYAFYEAKSAKRLDYGFLEEKQCADQKVIEHDWQNVLRELVLHVIRQTPVGQF